MVETLGDRALPAPQFRTVQYLRALAAVGVVAYHCVSIMNPLSKLPVFKFGVYGVDLFFVISGFIMITATRPGTTLSVFMKRRIIRIVPLYWVGTMCITIAAIAAPSLFKSTRPDLLRVLLSLFFIPHFHAVNKDQAWPVLSQGWTLNYEMFFYLILGLLFAPLRSPKIIIPAALLFFLVAVGQIAHPSGAVLQTYTNPALLEFVFGIIVARVLPRLGPSNAVYAILFFIIAAVAFLFVPLSAGVVHALSFGAGAASILSAAIVLETWTSISLPIVGALGDASFAIYLFHPFALGLVRAVARAGHLNGGVPLWDAGMAFAGIVLSSGLGLAIHYYVERPMTRLLKSRWGDTDRANNVPVRADAA